MVVRTSRTCFLKGKKSDKILYTTQLPSFHLKNVLKKRKIDNEKLSEERSANGDEEEFVSEEPDRKERFCLRSCRQSIEHVEKYEARERHRSIPANEEITCFVLVIRSKHSRKTFFSESKFS